MTWRRILLLSIALVSGLAVATWALLQNSDFATDFVRRALQEALATPTRLAATSIDVKAGRLVLEGLEVTDPTAPERALLRVERGHVDASFDPGARKIAARHVVFEGVRLDVGPELPTLSQLLRARPEAAPAGAPVRLPVVEIRSGAASLRLVADEPPLVVDRVSVTATPVDAAQSALKIDGSLHLAEPAAELTIRGEVDLSTGAARFEVQTAGVGCTPEVARRFARLAGVDEPELDIGGRVDSLRLICRLPAPAPEPVAPHFEIDVRCSGLHVRAPMLPAVVRSAEARLFVDTLREGGTLQADVSQHDDLGDVTLRARMTHLASPERLGITIDAKGRDVVVDKDVLAALRTFPIGRDVVAALQPSAGRGDIDLFLENPHLASVVAEMDLQLRDVGMSFAGFGPEEQRIGFPMPLEHGSGTVHLRDRVLLLRDMRASIPASAGGGDVTLAGRIVFPRDNRARTALDIRGERVAFEADLRRALATLLRDDGALYDRLAPSGSADVHVQIRPPDQLPGGFGVEIRPRDAAMRWAGFPYALTDLQGTIDVRGADARFDLTGRHGDGGLSMQGHIPLSLGGDAPGGFEAVVELEGLAIDEDLRAGVAVVVPELDPRWRAAAPTGRLSGTVKVWRPRPDDELHHDVRLMLEDVDLALPQAPWRAEGLEGQVLVQGSGPTARIDFDALRGQLSNGSSTPARLALLGHIESGPEVVRDLAFVVRDLQLEEQLGRTLDALGALTFDTWRSLSPSGRVDLVVRDRKEPDGPQDLGVVVQLVDVRSDARMLPRPAEHLTGELLIGGGQLTFRDVRGELGDATVHCTNGRVGQLDEADSRTLISFDVHAKDVAVDDGLANLFSGPLREAILQRKLRGRADVDGLRLRFRVPSADGAEPFATTIGGSIGLDGVHVLMGTGEDGIRLEDLRGVVVLADSTVTESGGQLVGTLSRGSLSLFGHRIEGAEMTFTADAEQLRIPTLKARLHEGELRHAVAERPAVRYLLPGKAAPAGRLSTELQFARVDVSSLLAASGWPGAPYKGLASGELKLDRLDGDQVVGAEAAGRLSVERADLGKVPLFKAIYAQLPAADQPRFNALDLRFEKDAQQVRFEQLEIRSELLAAKGEGALDLDGYLDVRMKLDNLLGQSADPLVMPLIDFLAKNLVSFRLYGHLRDLRASTDFLRATSPQRRAVLPMPPVRPARSGSSD